MKKRKQKGQASMSTLARPNLDSGNELYLDPYIQQITNKEKAPSMKRKNFSKLTDS